MPTSDALLERMVQHSGTPDGGPTLRDLCGLMLSMKDHNKANIGDNGTGRAWEAWKEVHPAETEVMLRFLAEGETEDGARIHLEDYTPPKGSRTRFVIKLPDNAITTAEGEPAKSKRT